MKLLLAAALVVTCALLSNCVTVATQEITRTRSDDQTLTDSAIIRPFHPKLGNLEERRKIAQVTFAHDSIANPNRSVRGFRYDETARGGRVLVPGNVRLFAGARNNGLVSNTHLRFEAQRGVIYRVRVDTSPESTTHSWKVFEENSKRIVFSETVPATTAPIFYSPPVIVPN